MKKLLSLLLVSVMALSLVACGTTEVPPNPQPNPPPEIIDNDIQPGNVEDNTEVDTETDINTEVKPETEPETETEKDTEVETETSNYDSKSSYMMSLIGNDGETNIMISPMSLNFGLALLMNAADEETLTYMENYFGQTLEEVNLKYGEYMKSLDETVVVANSIWTNEIELKDSYKEAMKSVYLADVESLDFVNSESVKRINDWVNEGTKGMIPSVFEELDDEMLSILINTIYFENKWAQEFNPELTEDKTFTLSDGSTIDVPTMTGSVYSYFEDDSFTGFSKDYAGNRYRFVAILPKDNVPMDFGNFNMENFLDSEVHEKTNFTLPKFTFEYSIELKDVLAGLGLDFNDARVNLNNMFENEDESFSVSSILQKTKVELTESGTKAAAVTTISLGASSLVAPEKTHRVDLDKSFGFVILDKETDVPLFIGTVNNPLN